MPLPELTIGFDTGLGAAIRSSLALSDELSSMTVIDVESGRAVATTTSVESVAMDRLTPLLTLFDDRDETIRSGIDYNGEHFDVHRFCPDQHLIYGRRGNSDHGEGICVHQHAGQYVVFTYTFPTLSARAIPIVVDFARTHLVA